MAWSKWVEAHRAALVLCGIPSFLIEDQFRWERFVEHGYDHETGWSPELLPTRQRATLQAFLRSEYSDG